MTHSVLSRTTRFTLARCCLWAVALTLVAGPAGAQRLTLSQLQAQLDALEARAAALETAVAGLDGDVTGLQAQVATLQAELGALALQVEGLGDDVSTLQAETTTQQGQIDALDSTVAKLEGFVRPVKLVFLLEERVRGDFGGVAVADQKCTEAAEAAGLPGTYKAWLSDSTSSPSTRFVQSDLPYVLLNGELVALDWEDLTAGVLRESINVTEFGNTRTNLDDVWTATSPSGSFLQPACEDWTVAGSSEAVVGSFEERGSEWSDAGLDFCGAANPLYCFQQ